MAPGGKSFISRIKKGGEGEREGGWKKGEGRKSFFHLSLEVTTVVETAGWKKKGERELRSRFCRSEAKKSSKRFLPLFCPFAFFCRCHFIPLYQRRGN